MATRPLTKVEALPRLEPIGLEGSDAFARPRARGIGSWARGALTLDAAMLLAACVAAQLGSGDAGILRMSPVWLVAYSALVLIGLRMRGLYSWRVRVQALDDVRAVLAATVLASMAIVTLRILLPGDVDDLAAQALRLWAFSAVYLAAGRVALDWSQVKARRDGELARPTLIVGAGRIGRLTARASLEQPEFGLRPIGFLDKEPLEARPNDRPVPVLGRQLGPRASHRAARRRARRLASPPPRARSCCARSSAARSSGSEVSLVPRLFETITDARAIEPLGGLPLLRAHQSAGAGSSPSSTRSTGSSPLIVCSCSRRCSWRCAVAVCISLGRPIFFRQRRVGRDGHAFDMLKFRSMRPGGDPARLTALPRRRLAPGGVEGDDRRTRVGALPAPHVARRASAAAQRAPRRDEPRRAAARAARSSSSSSSEHPPLRRPPSRQVGHHRLGPGARPARADLARRSGRVGQLLHRELVARGST